MAQKRHAASSHFYKRQKNYKNSGNSRNTEWARDNMLQRPNYTRSLNSRGVKSGGRKTSLNSIDSDNDKLYSRSKQQ